MARILVLGDIHDRLDNVKRVLVEAQKHNPELVLCVGDISSAIKPGMNDAEYQTAAIAADQTAAKVADYLPRIPFAFVPGNHDPKSFNTAEPYNLDSRIARMAGHDVTGIGGSGPALHGWPYEWTDEELSVFLETLAEAEEWDPFEAAKKRAEIKKMAARKKAKKEAGKGIAGLSRKEELADADRELDAAMKAGAEEADEAGLCTCAYPRKSATSSNCRKCGKPMKAQESFFNTENVEILRSAIYESTTPDAPEAKDQRLKIARCIGEAHKKLQTNLQEAALAVFADDESIDKVIDSIVGAMADQGMDMTPAGAIDTMVGDIDAGEEGSEGLPELPMPGTPDVPDEGPGEGPEEGEGPPESFQFGAEEEEDEEGGEEEETEEEEEEITED